MNSGTKATDISNPRQVRIGPIGELYEMDGTQIIVPGLEPENIMKSLEDTKAGRYRPLKEIMEEIRARA